MLSRDALVERVLDSLQSPQAWTYHAPIQSLCHPNGLSLTIRVPGGHGTFSLTAPYAHTMIDPGSKTLFEEPHSLTIVADVPFSLFNKARGLETKDQVLECWQHMLWLSTHPDGQAHRALRLRQVVGAVLREHPGLQGPHTLEIRPFHQNLWCYPGVEPPNVTPSALDQRLYKAWLEVCPALVPAPQARQPQCLFDVPLKTFFEVPDSVHALLGLQHLGRTFLTAC